MARTVKSGERILISNSSGSTYAIANLVAIKTGTTAAALVGRPIADIADGATGEASISGVHELTAKSTDTASIGDAAYWDSSNTRITTSSTGNTYAGKFMAAKGNGDTTCWVMLNNIPGE